MTRPWILVARALKSKRRTRRCSEWTIDVLAESIYMRARLCGYIHSFWIIMCWHFDCFLVSFSVYCGVGPGGVGTGTASVCTESWKIQNISEKTYAISE
jgi:hypothetical protein